MKHILTLAVLALSVSSASFFAAPDAVAQDSSANEAKNSAKPASRVDYKSPPSPELLAKQRGKSPRQQSQSKTNSARSAAPSVRKAKTKKTKTRSVREMPL